MTAGQMYEWWFIWLGVAGVLVLAAAVLLITIVALAHRIATLAGTALEVVTEIEQNTKPIWQLNATNRAAGELLAGARSIEKHAGQVAGALAGADRAA
ncbi:hypothetical protein BH24PSE2_BH24PSE2_06560 [soil metagenome]